jgi:hypothetical protein
VNSRRRDGLSISMSLLVFAFLGFALGTFLLWNQHFGVPAHMTVESCGGSSLHRHGRSSPLSDLINPVCHGRMSGAPNQPVMTILEASRGDVGHDINVHIFGSGNWATAYKDTWWHPLIPLGIGCALGAGAVWNIASRRRRDPTQTTETAA